VAAGLTVVVDYGLCNVDSMTRALEECGAGRVECTRDPRVVARADRIVLPGVGSFAAAMRNLAAWGLQEAIGEASATGTVPFLGACLGMQLMAESGSEGARDGQVAGLGLVKGAVTRLRPSDPEERIPHIGWNEVEARPGSRLFDGLSARRDFYFVHSYHLCLADAREEAGRTPYCGGFTAAIEAADRPIFGTQFHPEKSQRNGFHLLRNFLAV
jgi:glutamine amidotransferase